MIKAIVCVACGVWLGVLLTWHYFGSVRVAQNERDRALDRREASLEVWSSELESIDSVRARRARADALLDRALGPKPLQLIDEAAE